MQGNFQLPMYSAWPDKHSPMTYVKFTLKDKIPCATLLVRIRKAKKPKGVSLNISDALSHLLTAKLNLIETPPNYKEGTYCTLFTKTTPMEEKIIYNEKNKRDDPILVELVCNLYKAEIG
jgi:hypothetical protein